MPEYSYKTNGLTLNYFCNDVEAKKTLVLIHGWTGGWEVWKPLIQEFSQYKIYALDLPGHNKSGHLKNYNINTYYPPLLDFVNSLPEDNLILVGHSLGSASSIEIASRSRKIQAMLLEDPPWFSENKNKSTSSDGQEAFFLENKPKWRTVLDAIFDYQNIGTMDRKFSLFKHFVKSQIAEILKQEGYLKDVRVIAAGKTGHSVIEVPGLKVSD